MVSNVSPRGIGRIPRRIGSMNRACLIALITAQRSMLTGVQPMTTEKKPKITSLGPGLYQCKSPAGIDGYGYTPLQAFDNMETVQRMFRTCRRWCKNFWEE